MKPIVMAIAVTSAVISASALAQPEIFVGGLYGQANYDVSDSSVLGFNKSDEANLWGLRVGSYVNPNIRAYLTYSTANEKRHGFKNETDNYLASADYLFGNNPIKPFVGVTGGLTKYKASGHGYSESNTDFAYGAQLGVALETMSNFDLELGYQYLKNDNDTKDGGLKSELDNTKGIYIAADYRF